MTLVVLSGCLAAVLVLWGGYRLFKRMVERKISTIATSLMESAKEVSPCYRCAAVATKEFMGLHYCFMCREMVSRVYPAAVHDPPFGFPGSRGYLEFPAEEKNAS